MVLLRLAEVQRQTHREGWAGLGWARSGHKGQGIFASMSEFRFLSVDHGEVSPWQAPEPYNDKTDLCWGGVILAATERMDWLGRETGSKDRRGDSG